MTTRMSAPFTSRLEVAAGESNTTTEIYLKKDTREFVEAVEAGTLERLTSEALKPSRISAVVDDHIGDRLSRMELSLKKIAESHSALVKEFHASQQEPCKRELQALSDEIAALRGRTKAELERLWKEVKALKGEQSPPRNDEPIEVRDEEGNPTLPPTRRKSVSPTRSRKNRARRSSSSRRKQRRTRRNASDEEWSDSSDSDADLSDGDKDDIRVADRDCRRVLSVESYRLHDRDPERDLGLRTNKVLQNLRHLFDGERFDGSDPLTVLHFLEELKITFDDAGLCEGDARHMVRYFLTGEAARLFKGLSPNDKRSYPRIVKWLLRTYVRESMLQNAREEFLTRAQKPHETEVEYSKALSDLAKRCAGMIPARDLTNRFVRGLRPAIRTAVQARVASNTSWAVAVALATEHGTAHREAEKEHASQREQPFIPYPRKRYAQGNRKTLVVKPSHEGDDSDLDEWWTREEEPAVFPDRVDGGTIGAIHAGSARPSRTPSYASLPASFTSSEDRYYTPQATFAGGVPRERPSPDQGKKVVLPPGVPFPARTPMQRNAPGTAYPCLGCGKLGHWLSDCPIVNPRVKDLALEALRTRKQTRQAQFTRSRDPSPARAPSVLLTREVEESVNAPLEEKREPSPEQTG